MGDVSEVSDTLSCHRAPIEALTSLGPLPTSEGKVEPLESAIFKGAYKSAPCERRQERSTQRGSRKHEREAGGINRQSFERLGSSEVAVWLQCALIGEQTDIQRLLLAHGAEILRRGLELINLPPLEAASRREGTGCSQEPSTTDNSEHSVGLETPPLLSACRAVTGQPGQSSKRASSAPLEGGTGLPGLYLGRLIGRGSFGRVYKGSWEGRAVAVKVLSHEGSTSNLLNALRESLVAEHVQHKNVVATYRVHTVERPAGQGSWGLYRSASLGQEGISWPKQQPGRSDLASIPSEGYPAGSSQGSSGSAAARKLEADASETASAESSSARASPFASVAAQDIDNVVAGDGSCQPSRRSNAQAPQLSAAASAAALPQSTLTSSLLTSPFEVTLQKATSSGLDDSVAPLTQLARRMSLEADLYSRQRVNPKWRSLSIGEPVPKMACPASLATPIEEESRVGSSSACSNLSACSEEADLVVETLLLMEHADLGSLNKYMVSARLKNDMEALLLCAMDVAAGMSYLHSINLLHGDLKTANVLLKSCPANEEDPRGYACKIADFGLSRLVSEGNTHVSTNSHGTIAYVAPEVLQTGAMAMPADVYSYAMLLLELWKGELVYRGVNTHQVLFQVFSGHKPELPGDMPADYRALVEGCWAIDPAARPTFLGILQRLQSMLSGVRAAVPAAPAGSPHAP